MKEKIKTWAFRLWTIFVPFSVGVAVWLVVLMCYVGAQVLFSKATAESILTATLACLIMKEIYRIEEKIKERKK